MWIFCCLLLAACAPGAASLRAVPLAIPTPTPTPTATSPQPAQPQPAQQQSSPTQAVYLPAIQSQFTPTPTTAPLPSPTPLAPLALSKGPTLIYTGQPGAMRVFWQWSAAATFRLEWGSDERYAQGSADVSEYDAQNHLYAYTISGLQPAARYLYRVVLGQAASLGSFRTAPAPDETRLKFVSYGDTRTYPELHDAVAGQVIDLYRADPLYQTLNLMVGDFVAYGDEESSWVDELFAPAFANIRTLMATVAWLPVMGNHEGSGALFTRYFPLPFVAGRYASFDYGPAHIVLLDQYVPFIPGSNQYAWLVEDLKATSKTWKIVVLHEPGWSAWGGHDNNSLVQTALQPLFVQSGVALVLAGHNHYYARAMVDGIAHLTVGTGGAPLYTPFPIAPQIQAVYQGTGYARFRIDGAQLDGEFVAADGQVKDSFHLQR